MNNIYDPEVRHWIYSPSDPDITRNVPPALSERWARVSDVGPALKQHLAAARRGWPWTTPSPLDKIVIRLLCQIIVVDSMITCRLMPLQSQKAVTVYLKSKKVLRFDLTG